MSRIEQLKKSIDDLYQAKNPQRADWADWLYTDHVFLVADEAEKLANRFGANKDLATAAAMLHDIADAVMNRFDPQHEVRSEELARELLLEAGFSQSDVLIVVNDAIRLHSCFDGSAPSSLEGKVMATADAIVHLRSDFYIRATQAMAGKKTTEEIKKWALPKIERDFNDKIQFEDVREETRSDYERCKQHFLSM